MDNLIEFVADGLAAVGEAASALWEAAAEALPDVADVAVEGVDLVADVAGEAGDVGPSREAPTTQNRGALPWSQ